MAVIATSGALKQLDQQQASLRKRAENARATLEDLSNLLNESTVKLTVKTGAQGRLYGSVTTRDVAQAIQEQHGYTVDHRKIVFDTPIRNTGQHKVTIRLAGDLAPIITLEVASAE